MSKLTEYLKLLPAGINNINAVVEGLRNNVKLEHGLLPPDEQDEIIRRRLICSTCPFMSTNAVANGVYTTKRTDEHCMLCGCPIVTKTSSLRSNCGIEAFNNKNPQTPLPLNWEAYKP